MKNRRILLFSILVWLTLIILSGCVQQQPKKNIKRVGMVVGINPDVIEEYKRLHADNHAGVRDLLTK